VAEPRNNSRVFYEDIPVGATMRVGGYRVDAEEIVSYAQRWDPLPPHLQGLAASGSHTLAIRVLLMHRIPIQEAVIAAAGWDEIRFHQPVRPGDELWLDVTWESKRRSESKRDRGIVTTMYRLVNQEGAVVLSHKGTIIMRLRAPD